MEEEILLWALQRAYLAGRQHGWRDIGLEDFARATIATFDAIMDIDNSICGY